MPDPNENVAAPLATKSGATLQPVTQADAPVVVDRRPQVVHVDDTKIDTTPQVVDGRVRASDDVSNQAVEQGYEPDIQPKAAAPAITIVTGVSDTALSSVGASTAGVVSDDSAGQMRALIASGNTAEAERLANESFAKKEAFERITAPLSARSEQMVQQAQGDLPELAVVDGAPGSVAEQVKATDESLANTAANSGSATAGSVTENPATIVPPLGISDPNGPGASPTGPTSAPALPLDPSQPPSS